MKKFKDLYLRPTFISIIGSILILLLLLIMLFQILFTELRGGASLGIAIEIIGLLSVFALILIDRKALDYIKNKKLSIIEGILILGCLTYCYFTNNNSFSIG